MNSIITVAGSINMDLIFRTARWPKPGETIMGRGFSTAAGGKGANQAVAAARLGAQVRMIGRTGRDGYGAELCAGLAREGIDVSAVRTDEAATGVALIAVADDGQNSIIVASGANMQVSADDVEAAREGLQHSAALLLQMEIPLEANRCAIELARAAGVLVIFNPAPAQPLPAEWLSLVDYVIPNETEAGVLSGIAVTDLAAAGQAARALRAKGAPVVIITLGAQGALVADGSGEHYVAPFKVNAVDTTAAGDAFVAGFAVALSEGRGLRDAVRFGNATGALAATMLGAQPSLPKREAVEKLLAQ